MSFSLSKRTNIMLILFISWLLFISYCYSEEINSSRDKPFNLNEVIEVVAKSNTKISSIILQGKGLKGLINQASLLPNPEVDVELENFSGDLPNASQSEFTMSISQLIETAGKRSARVNLAKAQRDAYLLEAKIAIGEVIGIVKLAYQRALFAKAGLDLAYEELKLAKDIYLAVKKKVEYGGVLNVELAKADIVVNTAKININNAKQVLYNSKNRLASFWGGNGLSIGRLAPLPPNEVATSIPLSFKIEDSPFYQLSKAKYNVAVLNYKRERALVYPDITARAGYRKLKETGSDTFVMSFSVPLPIFNRNQGALFNALNLKHSAWQEHINKTREIKAMFLNLQQQLNAQLAEKNVLKNSIIPQAKQALKEMQKAYSLGKASYLDLFDAQRRYLDVRRRYLDITSLLYSSQIKAQQFTGSILDDLPLNINIVNF